MRALTMVGLVALAACSPKPVVTPAAPVKPVVGDFSKPMDARGTEPFWALSIRGTTLTLTRPDHPVMAAVAPGAVIKPGQASWTGKTADGRDLKVSLYASSCSDGMSDHAYPYAAEVDVPDESPLSGCADKTAAMPKPAPQGRAQASSPHP
jgi:uncharacterized membrane protein